jgi:hypothetical protein
MKLAKDMISDKWCFPLNHPNNTQIQEIVDKIINNR